MGLEYFNATSEAGVEKEPLTPEENEVLKIGIKLHRAIKESDIVSPNMIARGQLKALSEMYDQDWKDLYEQYTAAMDKLSKESQKKVTEELQEQMPKLGLIQNPYSGEYFKPPKN